MTFFWSLTQLPLQFHASISHWLLLPACPHWCSNSHSPPHLHLLCFVKDAGNMRTAIFAQLMVEFLEELRSNGLCCPLPMATRLSLLVCLSIIYFLKHSCQLWYTQTTALLVRLCGISLESSFTWFEVLPASVCEWPGLAGLPHRARQHHRDPEAKVSEIRSRRSSGPQGGNSFAWCIPAFFLHCFQVGISSNEPKSLAGWVQYPCFPWQMGSISHGCCVSLNQTNPGSWAPRSGHRGREGVLWAASAAPVGLLGPGVLSGPFSPSLLSKTAQDPRPRPGVLQFGNGQDVRLQKLRTLTRSSWGGAHRPGGDKRRGRDVACPCLWKSRPRPSRAQQRAAAERPPLSPRRPPARPREGRSREEPGSRAQGCSDPGKRSSRSRMQRSGVQQPVEEPRSPRGPVMWGRRRPMACPSAVAGSRAPGSLVGLPPAPQSWLPSASPFCSLLTTLKPDLLALFLVEVGYMIKLTWSQH